MGEEEEGSAFLNSPRSRVLMESRGFKAAYGVGGGVKRLSIAPPPPVVIGIFPITKDVCPGSLIKVTDSSQLIVVIYKLKDGFKIYFGVLKYKLTIIYELKHRAVLLCRVALVTYYRHIIGP
jgi:hypothetical protein